MTELSGKTKIYTAATNDLMFKMLFGDAKNKDIIEDFLKSVLDIPAEEYEQIEITDPNFRQEEIGDKLGILDVKIKTKNEKIIDVEIQVARKTNMRERVLYYISKMIREQIGKSEDFKKIQKVVSIIIAGDHKLIEENDSYHNRFLLHDKNTNSIFSDKIEINTLELLKIPKNSDSTNLWSWLNFLKAKNEEEIKVASTNGNTAQKRAACIVKELNADEKTRALLEARENALRDYVNDMNGYREEGEVIGLQKGEVIGLQKGEVIGLQRGEVIGIQKGALAIARKALRKGMPFKVIADLTDLPIEEIQSLQNSSEFAQ
jgi:predicted transposase/invertase (TIGR01784 family)